VGNEGSSRRRRRRRRRISFIYGRKESCVPLKCIETHNWREKCWIISG
jgi:hypothetical protein